MTRTKHIFRQDVPCLRYAALGDTAVRCLSIHHIIHARNLDALVVPPQNRGLLGLWTAVFGNERIVEDAAAIPASYRDARVSAPTSLDWWFGAAGWNVFESVMWENGFFDTARMRITPPIVFPCNARAAAAMIYPAERTDGNRVYDSEWWIATCRALKERGYALHHVGGRDHPPLRTLYEKVEFERTFEATIDGLRACSAASSLAIGGSTGPTWTLLFSDIPQIVLESRRSPHAYWHFDRCQSVLTKRLTILPTLECLIPKIP